MTVETDGDFDTLVEKTEMAGGTMDVKLVQTNWRDSIVKPPRWKERVEDAKFRFTRLVMVCPNARTPTPSVLPLRPYTAASRLEDWTGA